MVGMIKKCFIESILSKVILQGFGEMCGGLFYKLGKCGDGYLCLRSDPNAEGVCVGKSGTFLLLNQLNST